MSDARPGLADESVWHEVECGSYRADLPIWRDLAGEAAGPVLELGCGTGRVALDLARRGHEVVGVDRSAALLAELGLRARADGLAVETVAADVRELELGRRFALVCAPMQLIHLLEGDAGRVRMYERVAAHLAPGGVAAIALLAARVDAGLAGGPVLPDVLEHEQWLYSSQPIEATRRDGGIEVRRLRQVVSPSGDLAERLDVVHLDDLDVETVDREARSSALVTRERIEVEPTHDHVGSTIVVLEGAR